MSEIALPGLPNNHNPSVSAVILAGGYSRRMGGIDKALLSWQGVPLIQRVYAVAAACCPEVLVVTPWCDRYQPIVSGPVEPVLDQVRQGPLVALSQALKQVNTEWVLLLACDLPCLNPEVLQSWISQLSDLPSEVMALVPRQCDRWEPLCGFYRLDVQIPLATFIQAGGRSFQQWLSQLPVQPLPVDHSTARMLCNCNTLSDLANQQNQDEC